MAGQRKPALTKAAALAKAKALAEAQTAKPEEVVKPIPQAEHVDPPVDDADEAARQALIDSAPMPQVMGPPRVLDEDPAETARLKAEIEAERAEQARRVAEIEALEAAHAQALAAVVEEDPEVRVMVLKSAQLGGFTVSINGESKLLQIGVAKRIPRNLLAVLDDSDVDYEIVE
jgi:hypothetical protein